MLRLILLISIISAVYCQQPIFPCQNHEINSSVYYKKDTWYGNGNICIHNVTKINKNIVVNGNLSIYNNVKDNDKLIIDHDIQIKVSENVMITFMNIDIKSNHYHKPLFQINGDLFTYNVIVSWKFGNFKLFEKAKKLNLFCVKGEYKNKNFQITYSNGKYDGKLKEKLTSDSKNCEGHLISYQFTSDNYGDRRGLGIGIIVGVVVFVCCIGFICFLNLSLSYKGLWKSYHEIKNKLDQNRENSTVNSPSHIDMYKFNVNQELNTHPQIDKLSLKDNAV